MKSFISRNRPRLALASVACVSVLVLGTAMYGGPQRASASRRARRRSQRPSIGSGGISLTVVLSTSTRGFLWRIEGHQDSGQAVHLPPASGERRGRRGHENSFMESLIAANVTYRDVACERHFVAFGNYPAVKKGIPVCVITPALSRPTRQVRQGVRDVKSVCDGVSDGNFAVSYFKSKHMADPQIGMINCAVFEACLQRDQGFEKRSRLVFRVPKS